MKTLECEFIMCECIDTDKNHLQNNLSFKSFHTKPK